MSNLISIDKLTKSLGSKLLFEELSFVIGEREKLGLIGPNGAGKSTLLKILAGIEPSDGGTISRARGKKWAYVEQNEFFNEDSSLKQIAITQLQQAGRDPLDSELQAAIYLSMVGFQDQDQTVATLSGGWRKRLSLAIALAKDPDLLILDEPTNHMDWDGILWLEDVLKSFKKAFVLVSHDRTFLNHLCNRTMEINRLYKGGYLSFEGGYQNFLTKKVEYIQNQRTLQASLSNKARREVDWLRAGVQARTTKSQSRIDEAHQLLEDLSEIKSRNLAANSKVRLEIDSAGKRSKKLIELKRITISFEEKCLIKDLNLTLGPKTCLSILGSNGSGKTSLLKVIAGQSQPYNGEVILAEDLKITYFDQMRGTLPQDINLIDYLGDGSDYAIFKGVSIHVASYASRFLFTSDKMKLKISQLSGGEQARLLIAKILMQPTDVLILDEPTNDLDIDSIEVLEQTLSSFDGLVIVVSHDRYFLSQLCQKYLALDGDGRWQMYPDLNQWLSASRQSQEEKNKPVKVASKNKPKVSLSYKEKQLMSTIEKDIENAEAELQKAQSELEDPSVYTDNEKMQMCLSKVAEKHKIVEELYASWESIEAKLQQMGK